MPFIRNLWAGALAGLTGSTVMHGFRLAWELRAARDNRDTIFGFDRETDINAARLIYRCFSNAFLPDREAARLGIAMHYGFGCILGIVYVPMRCPNGGLFGALVWILTDEIPITVLNLSDPWRKSPASHASALVAHLLFGITVQEAIRGLHSLKKNHLEQKYG
jgi:uncharacterized membrane protein YagU involved in acid resistance